MALTDQLDRLAAFEPAPYPVISLYLNTQPGQTGREQFHTFVRKEFAARSRTYPPNSTEREVLEQEFQRISRYLDTELHRATNGVAIFACGRRDLFEAVQLGVPIAEHWMSIADRPHLYPLARLDSQHPRYAAVLVDTNIARILVIATGEVVEAREVSGVKTRRTAQGGWSQARFQRHIENFHLHHAKDVVQALERIVQQDNIEQILLAGDEVILPLLREHMPKSLADRIVDHLRLDTGASVNDIVRASLEAMKRVNERTDKEKVDAAVGAYRAGGLGVVGVDETLAALVKGQVDELLVTARLSGLRESSQTDVDVAHDLGRGESGVPVVSAGEAANTDPEIVRLADELVTKGRQTSARVTFIEDSSLLRPYGGVAALLRWRV